ncbi:hypothetical protein ABZP36_025017 [Zizania latifolia]
MASTAAAAKPWWMVPMMSVGAVETLKDQSGLCRGWNCALRSLHHAARDGLLRQQHGGGASSPAAPVTKQRRPAAAETAEEEGMRTIMYLSCCWGPS